MAGTVRLITNKPKLDVFEANVTGSYSITKDGEDSTSLEGMINLPLIEDKLAVRVAMYTDSQGGYIDNVPGTFTASNAINPSFPGDTVNFAAGTVFANGDTVGAGGVDIPVSFVTANNAALVEDDFNDATYQGIRIGLLYEINPDWNILLQHSRQTLKTEGVFDYDPTKGKLNVSRFTEDELEDSFSQTSWTVSGRLGALDVVYTGAYLDRDVDAKIDYTGYTNIGGFIPGYQCEYLVGSFYNGVTGATTVYGFDPTIGGNAGVIECGDPTNSASITNRNKRFNQELRVTSDFDFPVNFTLGAFYDNFEIEHVGRFEYFAPIDAGFAPIDVSSNPTFDGVGLNTTEINPATQFRNDNTRKEKQIAVFGELSWDISDQFNISVGARYYDLEYSYTGIGTWRYGNRPLFVDDADPNNDIRPNVTGGRSYDAVFNELNPIKVSDVIMKYTGTWTPSDDLLFYVTYSEGYRPPGFNRATSSARNATGAGQYVAGASNSNNDGLECGEDVAIDSNAGNGFPGYCLPFIFDSDTLENLEFGWKATIDSGAIQWNGAIYRIDWKDIQISTFDSQNISVLGIVDNAGDAKITGIESDISWAATNNLSLYAAVSYNDTELTEINPAFAFVVTDPGSPLPLTPKLQMSGRARYEWDLTDRNEAFFQIAGKYAGDSVNSLVDTQTEPQLEQDAYFLLDASAGVSDPQNGWALELFVNNITNKAPEIYINRLDFIERITTVRPRTIGLRMRYDF